MERIEDGTTKHREILEIINSALNAKPVENEHIAKFHGLIEKDFPEFCDKEPEQNDAKPLKILQHIEREMRDIAVSSSLQSKTVGAIGGGFSSGKSAFLNSFIDNAFLAVGIKPVTAIPTYLMIGERSEIEGISAINDGHFDIPIETYKKLSHDFLDGLEFNPRNIISHAIALAPMKEEYFENLCLIDTPGYNPGGAKKDSATALEYIQGADFLIWIIDIKSGTISKPDLDFIKELNFGKKAGKPLYIIANKAELPKPSDI